MKTIAFCNRSGVIGFTSASLPFGALPIGSGDDAEIRALVSARCRLAYDNSALLVPGVPEAEDDDAALTALLEFAADIRADLFCGDDEPEQAT